MAATRIPNRSRSYRPAPLARLLRLASAAGATAALVAAGLFTAPAAFADTAVTVGDETALVAAFATASGGETVTVTLDDDLDVDQTLTLDAGTLVLRLAGHDLDVTGTAGTQRGDDGGTGLVVAAGARLIIAGPGTATIAGADGQSGAHGDVGPSGGDGASGTPGAFGSPVGGDGGDGGPGADGAAGADGLDGGDGGQGGDGVRSAGMILVAGATLAVAGGDGGFAGNGGSGGEGGNGGDGGQGGDAFADDAHGGTGGTGGYGGDGGDGGKGGVGGDGGEALVTTGSLAFVDGATLAGAGTAPTTGEPGAPGAAGGPASAGDPGVAGWPVNDSGTVPDGVGGDGGDGGYGGSGGYGGLGGDGGEGGAGLSALSSGVFALDAPIDSLVLLPNAIFRANNGTAAAWAVSAETLEQVAALFDAAELAGSPFPVYAGHTLLGWSAAADSDALLTLTGPVPTGQEPAQYYAQWEAVPTEPDPSLADTGADAGPLLAVGTGTVAAGLVVLAIALMRRRRQHD